MEAALACGDVAAADDAANACWPHTSVQPDQAAIHGVLMAQVALARGDVLAARRFSDDAVAATMGWHRMVALTVRARVAIVEGEAGRAGRDAHAAVASGADAHAYLGMADAVDCLATLAAGAGAHHESTRLFAAAATMRSRTKEVCFQIYSVDRDAVLEVLRNAMGQNDFDTQWRAGADLSNEAAIAYAQRGRGERKRPASGWAWA